MINIFFDTEFSHLPDNLTPEPPVLISIGCISEESRKFYAENTDLQIELCSEFTVNTVLPLLEAEGFGMSYSMVAKQLCSYIESFHDEVKMWSDAPYFDWPFVKHMFDCHGWPSNLHREPATILFPFSRQQSYFLSNVEFAFETFHPQLRRHHALDDAIANHYAFQKVSTK